VTHWFQRRPWGEFRLFAQALLALTVTRLTLHWAPLPVVRRRVWRALLASKPLPERRRLPMARVLRCAAAAARWTPAPATCLAMALVAQALLHRHGYSTQLRIGVRFRPSEPFQAHAWLEHEGRIVVGGPAAVVEQYQVLPDMEHLIA